MYQEHNLLAIQRRFPTELSCRKHLERQRWLKGFRCPHCGSARAGLHKPRGLYQRKDCRSQVSLTARTIFHKTRMPLKTWFWLILLMSGNKHGGSMVQAQRLLEIGSYKTIWMMAHKIRTAMSRRDNRYKLSGLIELDEAFFGTRTIGKRKSKTEQAAFIAVSTNQKGRPAFSRMKVSERLLYEDAQNLADTFFDKDHTMIKTDGKPLYRYSLKESGFDHLQEVLDTPKKIEAFLPWVHILISNAKRFLQGTHHRESPKHLQRFLDEFTYRFNRRWWQGQLFDRLLTACTTAPSVTFAELSK